jgi:hypothetical protein
MRTRLILLMALITVPWGHVLAQGNKTLQANHPLDKDPVRIVRVMKGTTEVKSDGAQFANMAAVSHPTAAAARARGTQVCASASIMARVRRSL